MDPLIRFPENACLSPFVEVTHQHHIVAKVRIHGISSILPTARYVGVPSARSGLRNGLNENRFSLKSIDNGVFRGFNRRNLYKTTAWKLRLTITDSLKHLQVSKRETTE